MSSFTRRRGWMVPCIAAALLAMVGSREHNLQDLCGWAQGMRALI